MRGASPLRRFSAAGAAVSGLLLFAATPAQAAEDLKAELTDAMIVCSARCDGISVKVHLRNDGPERLCIPSNDIRFLPGSLTFLGEGERLDSYNGGTPFPQKDFVDATSFDFPVYVVGPGKELLVQSSGNRFFNVAKSEAVEVELRFRYFSCGESASKETRWRSLTISGQVHYEDAYDAPGVDLGRMPG